MNNLTKNDMMKLMKSYRWSLLLALFVIAGCSDDDETQTPAGEGNIRLLEVDVQSGEVELRNFGNVAVDLSGYYICNLKSYAQLSTLTNDDLSIDPNETIVLNRSLDANASDVSIYFNNADFGDPVNMVDFMQYGADVGTNGRADVAVSKGIWTTGDFVEGSSEFEYNGNGSNNGASFWSSTGVAEGNANVRIISVDPSSDEVTIKNFGDTSIDISDYQFCRRKTYDQVNSLTTGGSDLTLDPDEEITFTLSIDDNSSDVSLYMDGTDFTSADKLIDFMQFGDDLGTGGRVDIAVTKGIWTDTEYINGVAPYTYNGDGTQNGLASWEVTSAGSANVRLFAIDPSTDEVTLKNFGNASSNISTYWFCRRFDYSEVSTLNAASGNFILAPNEEITITVSMDDTSSDMGFYSTNSFASSTAMIDFMQYGEAGIGRESVANTKGIWVSGEFVVNPGPFSYTGDGTTTGASTWD